METFGNNPSVSVIIPVHNGGPEFRKCLESVQASTIPPDEIIVMADGDTDKSRDLAMEFATEVLKTPTPIGPARGRNMAPRKANGDILLFIDADITIPRNAISRIVETFKGDSCLANP
jgi:glycosyltransferase involved in cell wall biosynthesis